MKNRVRDPSGWKGAGLFLLAVTLGCESTPVPPPVGAEPPPPSGHSEMTLSVTEVTEPGWSGRVVVASFSNGADRQMRVLPSARPRPLQEIVAGVAPPQPFAAINGGFYETDGEPMGLVRAGGRERHGLGERGGSGVFYVSGAVPHIVHRDAYPSSEGGDALQSIDRLVAGGRSVVSEAASDRRAARSAVAIDAEGALHLVVAFDERAVETESEALIQLGDQSGRTGPTIAQMAALLLRSRDDGGVGAQDALGLDGGFSTSLVVKSEARALTIVPFHATINALVAGVNLR